MHGDRRRNPPALPNRNQRHVSRSCDRRSPQFLANLDVGMDAVTGGIPVSRSVDFRDHVADCLRMAEQAQTQTHKALLLDLAQAWVLLAEQAKHVGVASESSGTAKLSN